MQPSATLTLTLDSSVLFLRLFPEIDTTDLHIFTPLFNKLKGSSKFMGKRIDPHFYKYLNFDSRLDPAMIDTSERFYSCYQFKLTDKKTGLLIRRPSQYYESAIDLYTWDNSLKKVISVTNLTDAFGDEGWHFVQDAWIKDLNNDQKMDIVIRRKDYNLDLDDTTKVTRSDSVFVLIGNGTGFKKKSIKVDTSKFQLLYWSEKE